MQRSETSRSVGSLGGRPLTSVGSLGSLGGRPTTNMTNLGGKTVVSGRNLRSSLSKSVESIEQVVVGPVSLLFTNLLQRHDKKLLPIPYFYI